MGEINEIRYSAQDGESPAVLSMSQSVNFTPVKWEVAAGVVAGVRAMAKKVWNVDIRLSPTFDALPVEVKQAISAYGKDTKAKGVLYKGHVYLVADEHESASDLETTILHEIKGHVGIRRLYGDDISRNLNALFYSIGGVKGLNSLANSRGFAAELRGYAESLANSKFTDAERTQVMMEELLSNIAQEPKFFDKVLAIVGKIRQWLRSHGFQMLSGFGETDLLAILADANNALERKGSVDGPVVLMSANRESSSASDAAPVFISQLAEAFKNAPDRMFANGNSARLWLAGNAPKLGIKSDEIAWSGIGDYLEMRGKEKVTKAEVVAFLSDNGVKVKDVVLGGIVRDEINKVRDKYASILKRVTGDAQDAQTMADAIAIWASDYDARDERAPSQIVEDKERGYELLRTAIDDDEIDGNEIHDAVDAAKAKKEDTKFSEYAVPGGENYRELLITLPSRQTSMTYPSPLTELPSRYEVVVDPSKSPDMQFSITPKDQTNGRPSFGSWPTEAAAVAEALRMLNYGQNEKATDEWRKNNESANFSSSHYYQNNILVHLRMDERTDADGTPTLFIQEIQSDFAQSYRKQQKAIGKAVDAGFLDIVERMKKDGVLEVNCN